MNTAINSSDDLDDLTKELLNTQYLTSDVVISTPPVTNTPKEVVIPDINDDNLNDYILVKTATILENTMEIANILKDSILGSNTANPETLDSYSNVIKALNTTLDNLNKINIQNKKDTTIKHVKSLKPTNTINNILVTGSRDELMKKFIDNKNNAPIQAVPLLEESNIIDNSNN
jgi:hypothetical protein